jgi:parvulin-like peptidyl-prolyl isomerase
VNDEYITRLEFEEELGRFQSAQEALGKTASEEEAQQIVLDDLIDQVLLAQAAREQGFELTEDGLQSRLDALAAKSGGAEALAKWAAEHGYSDASFRLSLKRAAEAAWMRDRIVADVPASADQVHLQQILTYNEDNARQVLEKLNAGQDFNELAAVYDPVTRGELGWVPRGYLLDANIEQAAFGLPVSSFSDVIATPAGFHIIKVLAHEKHTLSPDALLMLQEQALKEWIEQQRQNSQITIAPQGS